MLSVLYFILALAATGLAIWYGGFYQPSAPSADYHVTYTWVSIGAAIIFGGLFLTSFVSRRTENANFLLEK